MIDKTDIFKKDEPEILMCMRVGQMKPLFNSVRTDCRKCKMPVWVSESGQKVLRQSSKLQVYCMECAAKEIEADESGEKPKFKVVPGALQELRRYFGKVGEN